jgi:putative spermidine/putrescine transport system ATP-binding protein
LFRGAAMNRAASDPAAAQVAPQGAAQVARHAAIPITLRGVAKAYGTTLALDHVDLDVRSGEFLTLLGPSGSGKTTLLMVLAGFIRPDQGSLRFGDQEVIRLAPHKRDVGMVFQNYALFPHLDVAANIAFPLKLRGVPKPETARRVATALEMVKLGGFGTRQVDELSGGQRQRVALARAIVFEPRIVLMDEPLSALDKQLREFMQIELRQLHDKLGMTTIYVTHDQREALTMSDRIAVIAGGRVQQIDTPRAIYEKPSNRFVAQFIGESSFLAVETDGGVCRCAGQALQVAVMPGAGRRMLLMLRPERVRLGDGERRDGHNVLDARVTDVIYQGDTFLVQAVRPDGSRISARGIATASGLGRVPAVGDVAPFGFSAHDAVLVAEDAA